MTTVNGDDPRNGLSADDLALARDGQPVVGRPAGGGNPFVIVTVFAILALGLFLLLNARRAHAPDSSLTAPATGQQTSAAAFDPPPPLDIAPRPPAPPTVATVAAPPPMPPPMPHPTPGAAPPSPPVDLAARRRAPSVVVDLQSANGAPAVITAQSAAKPASAVVQAQGGSVVPVAQTNVAGPASAVTTSGQTAALGPFDQFAAHASEAPPPAAVAIELGNLSTVITQGATIPGVLETAINSDLPGYARAVVSRDVRSFDGKAVLIPRGSRLIGQYRGGVAQGQSRVFIIWTRVLRPDGVSIQIASPGADALGRAGAGGEVNTHFFTRFGGSILLSVLSAGIAAIGNQPTTQISIGSPSAAAGTAAGASIDTGANIGPTIKIAQGQAINIFVSRDLDFSGVKAVQ